MTSPTRTRTRAGACVCLLWRGPGGGGVCAARARIAPLRAVRNGTRRAAAERDDGQVWRAQGQRKHFGRRLDGPRGPARAACAREAAQHATQTAGPRAARATQARKQRAADVGAGAAWDLTAARKAAQASSEWRSWHTSTRVSGPASASRVAASGAARSVRYTRSAHSTTSGAAPSANTSRRAAAPSPHASSSARTSLPKQLSRSALFSLSPHTSMQVCAMRARGGGAPVLCSNNTRQLVASNAVRHLGIAGPRSVKMTCRAPTQAATHPTKPAPAPSSSTHFRRTMSGQSQRMCESAIPASHTVTDVSPGSIAFNFSELELVYADCSMVNTDLSGSRKSRGFLNLSVQSAQLLRHFSGFSSSYLAPTTPNVQL